MKVETNQPNGKHLNFVEREKIKVQVTELYLKGLTYRSIKTVLDSEKGVSVSIATIGKYLNNTITEWKSERLKLLDDLKETELRRINKLEATYWNAWEKSLLIQGNNGNPQYLAGVQWCISMRCKILGIESPQITEISLKGSISRTTIFKTKTRKENSGTL